MNDVYDDIIQNNDISFDDELSLRHEYVIDKCTGCKFEDGCPDAHVVNFCEDCKDYYSCPICFEVTCQAGHELECNNGFEPKDDYECDDDFEQDDEE